MGFAICSPSVLLVIIIVIIIIITSLLLLLLLLIVVVVVSSSSISSINISSRIVAVCPVANYTGCRQRCKPVNSFSRVAT